MSRQFYQMQNVIGFRSSFTIFCKFSVELDNLEYAVNNMNAKILLNEYRWWKVKVPNNVFVALMWKTVLKRLLFFCHVGYMRGVARRVGDAGGDNVRQMLD